MLNEPTPHRQGRTSPQEERRQEQNAKPRRLIDQVERGPSASTGCKGSSRLLVTFCLECIGQSCGHSAGTSFAIFSSRPASNPALLVEGELQHVQPIPLHGAAAQARHEYQVTITPITDKFERYRRVIPALFKFFAVQELPGASRTSRSIDLEHRWKRHDIAMPVFALRIGSIPVIPLWQKVPRELRDVLHPGHASSAWRPKYGRR